MNKARHLLCQHVLGARRFTAVFVFFFQGIDLRNVHKGEEFEEAIDISIRGVDPELVEFVRTGFLRIQPHGAAFGFTEFGAVRFGDQRYGQAKHLVLMQTTGQIDAGGDVAPLVRAADLQRHAVQLIQAGKVVTLQQIVRELGKGDTLIVTIQTLLHRFFVDHLVNREVFTDIAQEGQHVHAAKPVIVIRRDRRVVAAVKIKERSHLFADFIHPLLHGILGV